jgi:predicted metal-dependent phosphoesterase TrpH
MLADLHLHTLVSDGELEPPALVAAAAAHGVTHLSITDHDSLAAYRWGGGAVFTEARRLGLELTVGIEMDVALDGREVHVLGYGVEPAASALAAHLEAVRTARRERARRELGVLQGLLGGGALEESEIFVPGRDVLMRPHFIRPLVERGHFKTYREGREWFWAHARCEAVVVPKPTLPEAVAMIHAAGGWAVLAHPGYYWRDAFPVLERLPALHAEGLDGVELDYPYRSASPDLFDEAGEREWREALRVAGETLGLRFTRGSDTHSRADLDRVYGPASE